MTRTGIVLVALISNITLHAAAQRGVTTPPPTTAAAEVTACAQAQMVVDSLLTNADARLENARQSNNPAELRAAVDALQTTIRDVRAQLAACANQGATDPHAGHATTPALPPAGPAAAKPPASIAKPAAPIAKPAAPVVTPPATDPHAGHTVAPAKPSPKTAKPTPAKPPADPHAGHATAPAAPKTAKPAAKPAAPAKPPAAADAHAGHAAPATPPSGEAKVVDPVCGLQVDPATAPSTKHGGQTYHFCSTQHRDLFTKNPAKFLPNKR